MRKELIEAGYREFKPCSILKKHAEKGWQKSIRGEHGKLYFITVYEYLPSAGGRGLCFTADGQFDTKDGLTCNMELFHGWTVKQLETFFETIYGAMG